MISDGVPTGYLKTAGGRVVASALTGYPKHSARSFVELARAGSIKVPHPGERLVELAKKLQKLIDKQKQPDGARLWSGSL